MNIELTDFNIIGKMIPKPRKTSLMPKISASGAIANRLITTKFDENHFFFKD